MATKKKILGYKTYNFVDKDPVIDLLRTIIFKEKSMLVKDVAADSGVSQTTLRNWFYGEVKRPQHATIMAVAHAIGYEYRLVPMEDRSERLKVVK